MTKIVLHPTAYSTTTYYIKTRRRRICGYLEEEEGLPPVPPCSQSHARVGNFPPITVGLFCCTLAETQEETHIAAMQKLNKDINIYLKKKKDAFRTCEIVSRSIVQLQLGAWSWEPFDASISIDYRLRIETVLLKIHYPTLLPLTSRRASERRHEQRRRLAESPNDFHSVSSKMASN